MFHLSGPALLHIKARSQENGAYPSRQPVADAEVPWDIALPGYAPAEWTHPSVLANSRELSTGGKWADPLQLERAELAAEATVPVINALSDLAAALGGTYSR